MLDHDKLKKRRAGSRAGTGWRPKDGESRVRVLPPHSRYLNAWESMEDIAVTFKIHFFRVEGRPTEVSLCLEQNKQRCPACEAWRTWRKSEDPGMAELAKQVAPADQYLMNILDLNNLSQGIQYWTSNYTCWDKILEIVADPQWGNVLDPADGVNFIVTKTPGDRSRSGYPQYSVRPEPERTDVMDILTQNENWTASLDALEDQVTAAKTAEEIQALLEEMNFPPPPKRGGGVRPPATPAAGSGAPSPKPPAPKPAAAAKVPVPKPVKKETTTPPETPGEGSGVVFDYDPGEDYEPVVPVEEHPEGAPRCWGDYDPDNRPCDECPVGTECQMKMLGVA